MVSFIFFKVFTKILSGRGVRTLYRYEIIFLIIPLLKHFQTNNHSILVETKLTSKYYNMA